jgi:hypothetical protein
MIPVSGVARGTAFVVAVDVSCRCSLSTQEIVANAAR